MIQTKKALYGPIQLKIQVNHNDFGTIMLSDFDTDAQNYSPHSGATQRGTPGYHCKNASFCIIYLVYRKCIWVIQTEAQCL